MTAQDQDREADRPAGQAPAVDPRSFALTDFAPAATLTIDGHRWGLPDGRLMRSLDDVRDRIFDESVTRGSVAMEHVRVAAFVLLSTAYDLQPDAICNLLAHVDDQPLADAVMEALFGPARCYNYTEWVVSALRANGLGPASVPADELDAVLRQLVLSGRAAEPEAFISSAAHAAKRRRMSQMVRR